MSDMSEADDVRENLALRAARRHSLLLVRSRRRDARAHGFGMRHLVAEAAHTLLAGDHVMGYGYDYNVEGYSRAGL